MAISISVPKTFPNDTKKLIEMRKFADLLLFSGRSNITIEAILFAF